MWFTIKCHCKCSEFQFMKKMEKFDENLWFHFREGIQISQFFHPGRKSKGFAGKPVGKIPYPPWKYLEMILSRGDFHRSTCPLLPPPSPFFRRFLDNMAMIFQNLGMENVCHVEHPKGVNAYRDNINFESTFRYIFHSHSRCSTCYCYIYILCSIITF